MNWDKSIYKYNKNEGIKFLVFETQTKLYLTLLKKVK